MHAIGTLWEDEGRVKVIVVQPNISIAQVENSCEYLAARRYRCCPSSQRPAPPLKPEDKFDRFAPPSGKSKAMVVFGKHFQRGLRLRRHRLRQPRQAQGVKVGDYFRIFRYTGQQNEIAYQTPTWLSTCFGYGGVSKTYKWDNVPREVLGEGIVLRTVAERLVGSDHVRLARSLRRRLRRARIASVIQFDFCGANVSSAPLFFSENLLLKKLPR